VVASILETAVPSEWSGTPPGRHTPVPALGQHTVEVLREAGYGDVEIDQLVAMGAAHIGQLSPSAGYA
jgi:crotonobetainyl-CoA:carnitine CoA-transferase CaiB-like acyl-CoA transferase